MATSSTHALTGDSGRRAKRSPIIRSFSLDKETIGRLESIAGQKKVSVNLLVNDILDNYARMTNPLENFGIITMAKADFRRIIEQLPERALVDAGTKSGDTCLLFWFSQMGNCRTVKSVEELMKTCASVGVGSYNEEEANGRKIVSINHALGMSYSIYLKACYERVLASIADRGDSYKKIEAYDNCVIFYK